MQKLFQVENSDFENYVSYYAKSVGDGYECEVKWCGRGSGEPYRGLNTIENTFAYGFTLKKEGNNYNLYITALKKRPLRLIKIGNDIRVIIRLNNAECILNMVWVQCHKGALGIPKVDYVDIHGTNCETGEEVTERTTK